VNATSLELRRFGGAEALARFAAGELLTLLRKPRPNARPFLIALSGGRIAARFCSEAAGLLRNAPEALAGVHCFWADERCVPPDHPESNYKLAFENLLDQLPLPADHIHRIEGELPPEAAAAKAARDIQTVSGAVDRPPILDLVVLGMGEDGHVASLFPGESELAQNSPAVYRAVKGPKPPPDRVTLGYPVLFAAREVWVLVSGEGKQEALGRSVSGNCETPLGKVIAARALTRVWADSEGGAWVACGEK
jgi:6-phosphogluconolactonase